MTTLPPHSPQSETPPSTMRGFESSLPIALLRARQATAHKFKPHTDEAGLTQPQWRVIRALAAGSPMDVASLAERCVLMQPSVSRLLKGLQDRGLIETVTGPDARRRLLSLTEAGKALFTRIAIISEAVYRDIEEVYGRDELKQLVAMLTRLREVAEALPDLPRTMPELP